MFSVLLPLTNSFGKMDNLNFSPDQVKGILSLFASGKLQRVFEEASSSMGLHSIVLLTSNGIARNNPREDVEDQVSEDETGMANFSGETSPELGERESNVMGSDRGIMTLCEGKIPLCFCVTPMQIPA